MRRLFIFLTLIVLTNFVKADDTASLNAALAAGNVTLSGAHGPYNISGALLIPAGHTLNGNSIPINSTQTTGSAIQLTGAGASATNVILVGPWNYATMASNPSGSIGIRILASGTTIYNCNISGYAAYGIFSGNFSNLSITYNVIRNTGYIGFYFDAEANGSANNTFSNNTIDETAISPSTIAWQAAAIRGSTSAGFTTSNWTISNNTFKMPVSPTNWNANGIELRYLVNSTYSNNLFQGGYIGLSVVRSTGCTGTRNRSFTAKSEGIEYASSNNCTELHSYVTGSTGDGLLLDGYSSTTAACTNLTFKYDTAINVTNAPFHSYVNNSGITVVGCYFKTNGKGINLQNTSNVTIDSTKVDGGSHAGSSGVFIDNGPGTLTMHHDSLLNLSCQISVYSTTLNQLIDYIRVYNTAHSGTSGQLCPTLSNGAHLGTNILFSSFTYTFNPIPAHVYGDVDFDPGATSSESITYSSSNTSVATIVSGLVHIVGQGSTNITASTSDTTLAQPLTISKAPLVIQAVNKTKLFGAALPSLTYTISGFVYGEGPSVFTSPVTISTTALSTSPLGRYPITVSGAAAANYSITFGNGYLDIYGGTFILKHAVTGWP
jgi:hypothetical protein